jgi:hypothetical protein
MWQVYLMVLWIFSMGTRGQGTILFHADLSGNQMTLPSSTTATASADFSLDSGGGLFGTIEFHDAIPDVNAVAIYFPASATEVGARMYLFNQEPPPMNGYFFGRQLTSFEQDFLFEGKWYVTVEAQNSQNSIRGQILQAPEPSTVWMAGVGLAVVGFAKHWRGSYFNWRGR